MNHSRWTATTLAIAVVAVVAASTFTFLAFTKDDGASTPDDAARAMITAIQQGDLLGVIDQLPPGERRALHDTVPEVGTQLQRLGLIAGFDGSRLDGVQPTFDHPTFSTTVLGKDIVAVDLNGGSIAVPLGAGSSPPLTDHGRQLAEKAGFHLEPGASTWHRDFSTDPARVVAIREGGGWHISVGYSVAEAMRKQADVPLPELGKGPDAIGSSTPSEAVSDLIKAYANGDPERVLTVMSPDEVRALYDYGPAFLPMAKTAAKLADAEATYDVQANRIEVAASGSGPQRTVRVTALDIDTRDEIKKTHVVYDGKCLHTDVRILDNDSPFASSNTCDGEWKPDDIATRARANPVANLAVFGGGADLPTFVVDERDGRWFISPTETLLGSLADTLANVPADKVDVMADRFIASWKAGAGDGISGQLIVGTLPNPTPSVDERRIARAAGFADACFKLAPGAQADAVGVHCLQHAIDSQRVEFNDLPTAVQSKVQPRA